MSLFDLINVATLGDRFMHLIKTHYIIGKYRLHEQRVRIVYGESLLDDSIYAIVSFGANNCIANGYNESLAVLRSFGSTFARVEVDFGAGSYRSAGEVSHYLNTYCAAPSIRLIRGAVDSYAPPVNVTFAGATAVTLEEDFTSDSFVDEIRLDRTFPHMQTLTIDYYRQLESLARSYPNLREFRLRTTDKTENFTKLYEFFRLNQQLRTIHTPLYLDHEYLRRLNAALPDIESLSLTNNHVDAYESAGGVVEFANVKELALTLRLYSGLAGVPERLALIRFKQLRTISIASMGGSVTDFLVEWMASNGQLTTVSMERVELSADQLRRLVELLPALQELSFEWSDRAALAELRAFLAGITSDALKGVTVFVPKSLPAAEVMALVPAKWTLQRVGANGRQLRFERAPVPMNFN